MAKSCTALRRSDASSVQDSLEVLAELYERSIDPLNICFQGAFDLFLDGATIASPNEILQLLISVRLDFGEVSPEYLVAAGPGAYDLSQYGEQ